MMTPIKNSTLTTATLLVSAFVLSFSARAAISNAQSGGGAGGGAGGSAGAGATGSSGNSGSANSGSPSGSAGSSASGSSNGSQSGNSNLTGNPAYGTSTLSGAPGTTTPPAQIPAGADSSNMGETQTNSPSNTPSGNQGTPPSH